MVELRTEALSDVDDLPENLFHAVGIGCVPLRHVFSGTPVRLDGGVTQKSEFSGFSPSIF